MKQSRRSFFSYIAALFVAKPAIVSAAKGVYTFHKDLPLKPSRGFTFNWIGYHGIGVNADKIRDLRKSEIAAGEFTSNVDFHFKGGVLVGATHAQATPTYYEKQ